VMFVFTMVTLSYSPYVEATEDTSQFVSSVSLTLTFIGGFALMTDNEADPTYERNTVATLLILINVLCMILEIGLFLVVDVGGCLGSALHARRMLRHSNILNNTEIFRGLEKSSMVRVIKAMKFRQVRKGRDIVLQGDVALEMMVIISGHATVYINGSKIRRVEKLGVIGEGALAPLEAGSKPHCRGATVTADTDVQVLVLSRDKYKKLLEGGVVSQESQERVAALSRTHSKQDIERRKSMQIRNGGGRTKVTPSSSAFLAMGGSGDPLDALDGAPQTKKPMRSVSPAKMSMVNNHEEATKIWRQFSTVTGIPQPSRVSDLP